MASFGGWWSRAQPVVRTVVTVALVVTGAVLVLDGGWWFASGDYLLPEP